MWAVRCDENEDGEGIEEKEHGCHRKKFDFCPEVLGWPLKIFRQEHGYQQSTRQSKSRDKEVLQSDRKQWLGTVEGSAGGNLEVGFGACQEVKNGRM